MRKLLIAASVAALTGLALPALAQGGDDEAGPHGHGHMLFQADADDDGVLTRSEFDAGRAELFSRLDQNSDGALAADEMRPHRGRHHSGGHHGMGLDRADADNDGAVTRDEFLAGPIAHFERLDADDDGVIRADERPQRRERRERHGRFDPDADNDGAVSADEFAAAGAAMFERLDADDDNRVTRAEADAARPPWRRPRD